MHALNEVHDAPPAIAPAPSHDMEVLIGPPHDEWARLLEENARLKAALEAKDAKPISWASKREKDCAAIKNYLDEYPQRTSEQIAAALNLKQTRADRLLREMRKAGEVAWLGVWINVAAPEFEAFQAAPHCGYSPE